MMTLTRRPAKSEAASACETRANGLAGAHFDYGPDELDRMPRIELYRADERGKEDGFRGKTGWRGKR